MELNEAKAYALATWERLEHEIDDEVLRAVCGAFALVSVADGELERVESDRFSALMRERFESLRGFDFGRVEPLFRDLTDALQTDPEEGRRRALESIARVCTSKARRELVQSAAQLAAAADARVVAGERAALTQIDEALRRA